MKGDCFSFQILLNKINDFIPLEKEGFKFNNKKYLFKNCTEKDLDSLEKVQNKIKIYLEIQKESIKKKKIELNNSFSNTNFEPQKNQSNFNEEEEIIIKGFFFFFYE